jgi:hypothetical protein
MGTGMATRHGSAHRAGSASPYEHVWFAAGVLTGALWVAVALAQSPHLPLGMLVLELAAVGGALLLRAPISTAEGRRQYLTSAVAVGALVLVIVGMGHHLEAGLVTAALLAGTSPPAFRWVGGH